MTHHHDPARGDTERHPAANVRIMQTSASCGLRRRTTSARRGELRSWSSVHAHRMDTLVRPSVPSGRRSMVTEA
jgi:hypothetical protein